MVLGSRDIWVPGKGEVDLEAEWKLNSSGKESQKGFLYVSDVIWVSKNIQTSSFSGFQNLSLSPCCSLKSPHV
jgi:hypothetical protein